MRSPAEYEKLREKVKGPEELAEEMDRNEALAEAKFALETEPRIQEALRQEIEQDLSEQGLDMLLESAGDLSPDLKAALEAGNFSVTIESMDDGHDQVALSPEGNISEKIPLKPVFTEKYTGGLLQGGSSGEATRTIEVLINGDPCGYIDVPASLSEQDILMLITSDEDVRGCLNGRAISKVRMTDGSHVRIETH